MMRAMSKTKRNRPSEILIGLQKSWKSLEFIRTQQHKTAKEDPGISNLLDLEDSLPSSASSSASISYVVVVVTPPIANLIQNHLEEPKI